MAVTVASQQSLPGLAVAFADRARHDVGQWGEVWTMQVLERAGYAVRRTAHRRESGDVIARDPATGEIWRVEVKTARRDRRGLYQWGLLKVWRGQVMTTHLQADVVILLAVLESGRVVPFVVPTVALAAVHKFNVRGNPETYAGRLAQFRQTANAIRLP